MTAVSPLGPSGIADEAFEALYEQYSRRVFRYCLKWLRSREEAEDAAQTTFLYAMRGLRRGVIPALDEAWLLAIARNVCRTRAEVARRRAVEVARSPQLLEESLVAPARNDELADLSEALGGLTEQQRRAILLREWQGLSYREIADELDLSQAAVETLLFRARRALAARLGGAGSFLPWLRSFAGGGAASLAVGATVVAATAAGTIGGGRPDGPARHIAPATEPSRTHLEATRAVPTPRPIPRPHAFTGVHVAALTPTPSSAAAPSATEAVVGSTQSPAARESTVPTPNPATAAAQPLTDAAKPVAEPAADTVETVVASATDATSTVESVASGAIATATDAVAATAETVNAIVPALPTVAVGGLVPSVSPLITP